MTLSKNLTGILIVGIIVGAAGSVALYAALTLPPDGNLEDDIVTTQIDDPVEPINVTLLYNAGVMIETDDTRIYIDPYLLSDEFEAYPADIILVTHPHGDHYNWNSIQKIATDDTVFIFPKNMSIEIYRHDAIGVNPGDNVLVGDINVTAFYMYTLPVMTYPASHPKEANWTSYIIDINGFTIFHAGDSKDIPEYAQLEGLIDLALIPLGPGCQTMYEDEVVHTIEMISPNYMIGIHFGDGYCDVFETEFGDEIEAIDGCQLINLDYWSSYVFQPDGN